MLELRNVTFMTVDPDRLAAFWAAALTLSERRDTQKEGVLARTGWPYPRYTFQRVEAAEQRQHGSVHVDLLAEDRPAEVARLRALGATEVRTHTDDGSGVVWTVMSDPDGNEFCVTS